MAVKSVPSFALDRDCPFHGFPFVSVATPCSNTGGSHEVLAPDLLQRGEGPVRQPPRGAAEGNRRGILRHLRHARHDRRGPAAALGDRDHGPGRGRSHADHGRTVRRHQGGPRRLLPVRGRRPRRGYRVGVAHPGRPHGRCDRGAPGGGALIEQVFRDEWGRVLATLIGFLGDFDVAEEAAQEAFAVAAERWPRDGEPSNPRAWLVTTARNRAIDRIRRDRTLAAKTRLLDLPEATEDDIDDTTIPDERLELIFTCCHPALALDAQVALTLRTLGGLS